MPASRQKWLVQTLSALHDECGEKPRGTAGAISAFEAGHESITGALEQYCGITPNWRARSNADMLHTLRERGATPEDVRHFMVWWRDNWRGKDGNPPSLAQVVEFWGAALVFPENGDVQAETKRKYEAETEATMRLLTGNGSVG